MCEMVGKRRTLRFNGILEVFGDGGKCRTECVNCILGDSSAN